MLNSIRLPDVGLALLSRIAWRSEPGPESWVCVTTYVSPDRLEVALTAFENSEVLPRASVAVAVIRIPSGVTGKVALKLASPLASVVTVRLPRYWLPSPCSDGSTCRLAKKSS